MTIFRRIPWVLLLCLLLAGCTESVEPTQPVTTTVETTTVPPTTEETVPETTAFIPLPLELDVAADEVVFATEELFVISGYIDPECTVTICGEERKPAPNGKFTYEVTLKMGENKLPVEYLGETVTYTVNRFCNVQSYSNAEGRRYGAGARMYLDVFARIGSKVEVEFNGEKKESTLTVDQLGSGAWEGFEKHIIWYDMPNRPKEDLNLGAITYTVTYEGETEVFTTGDIICNAYVEKKNKDSEATPAQDGYRNVGSGWIVEVVDVNVETFMGLNSLDRSYPYYNYLPQGTVDYGLSDYIYDPTGEQQFILLRCGVKVYRSTKNTPVTTKKAVVDCYSGTLPDHNKIGLNELTEDDRFTYLTLDTDWKAPFFFDVEEQEYLDTSTRDLRVENFDASYIDIQFCYATVVAGELNIPEDHPLFTRAEIIQNDYDHTLRLHLKKEGGLYGWNAYYNENDQLVFKFLKPATVTPADNQYGADLTGVRIMLDVGHGGIDIGAAGRDYYGTGWTESERNLVLSKAIQEKLESIGATVIPNRTTMEEMVTQRERIQFLIEQAPDYCLCIHHNSSEDKGREGYETGYFTSFSQDAADHIQKETEKTGLYREYREIWFYYYVSRQTACPIVLTENGFMTHPYDVTRMLDEEAISKKADAMVQGIVNYYLELNGYDLPGAEEVPAEE